MHVSCVYVKGNILCYLCVCVFYLFFESYMTVFKSYCTNYVINYASFISPMLIVTSQCTLIANLKISHWQCEICGRRIGIYAGTRQTTGIDRLKCCWAIMSMGCSLQRCVPIIYQHICNKRREVPSMHVSCKVYSNSLSIKVKRYVKSGTN